MFDVLPLGQMTPTSMPAAGATVSGPAPVVVTATGPAVVVNGVATTTGATTQDGAATPKPGLFGSLGGILPIVLMFGLLYVFLFRGQKKDEKKRKQMVAEMQKGDTVMTIGGLIARVVSVDGDNVVLKIDESANVKATYTKRSIQQVLTGDEKGK